MEQCSMCDLSVPKSCSYLEMYGELCKAMPDMEQCGPWSDLCEKDLGAWPEICLVQNHRQQSLPPMRMYFHSGLSEIMWFREWVPRSEMEYVIAVLFVFLLGILYEFIHTFRGYKELKWQMSADTLRRHRQWVNTANDALLDDVDSNASAGLDRTALLAPSSSSNTPRACCGFGEGSCCGLQGAPVKQVWHRDLSLVVQPFRLPVESQRFVYQFLETGIGYLLMLIAMTFNIGLFLAVLFGMATGTFLFGRFRCYSGSRSCC